MEYLIRNYESHSSIKLCFLLSKYIDPVLSDYKYYIHNVFEIHIANDSINLNSNAINIKSDKGHVYIVRVTIKIYAADINNPVIKTMKHANLLIIDTENKTIMRFEPLGLIEFNKDINDKLRDHFAQTLPSYSYGEYDFHPQKYENGICINMGLCVAYVIRFAVFYVMKLDYDKPYDDDDIYRFSNAIIHLYKY